MALPEQRDGNGGKWDDEDHIPRRTHISSSLARWIRIVDEVNVELRPSQTPVWLVPAGQAMILLHAHIEAGHMPGTSEISDFSADDIHPNAIGNYFITLVQFATIFGIDPDALPPVLGIDQAPSTALVAVLQDIVWEAERTATAGTG